MDELIRRQLLGFLHEDLGRGDITSDAVVPAGIKSIASVVARQCGIVAGLHETMLLGQLAGLDVDLVAEDGATLESGDCAVQLRGAARAILGVERTLLNLLSHMSGIATATRRVVEQLEGTGARIAATRKTLPGLRAFDKRAVVIGGGDPHRYDLGDAVLIKDNHLAIVGGVAEAVRRARDAVSFTCKVEIEVETATDALVAAEAGADILLLDNMSPAALGATVTALRQAGLRERVVIEASGGITVASARAYADAGAELVSMGALTSSAPAMDFSLEMESTD